jgi:hypothetical protein
MGEDTRQIRQDIDETRGRMGDTVEALGHKTDVTGRAKEAVSDGKESAQRAVGIARENPLGLGIGALAAGFIAGLLIPSTKVEDEKIGPLADDVKEKVRETGQEAVERGKRVAEDAAAAAKEAGREQAEGLRESAQEKTNA